MTTVQFRDRMVDNLSIDGVDYKDFPDFCDAYFDYAEWVDTGIPLNDDELNVLSEEHGDIINAMAHDSVNDYASDMYDLMMDR
ncbi:hypothetical protein UFOVP257_230 [uncultured Caudovirales phage]|uniref:Uncharacterized protein n=1 Tax=uncultured Caudovirales phage TaxID=2100421 RepID=A0A6J5LFP5_9CAUD|nr:hypothetical protein UFOVP257_230 [uncultured Caudovirales phage]